MEQKGKQNTEEKRFSIGKFAAILAVFTMLGISACKTAQERHQERVNMCSNMCKNHPEIESMSKDEGGLFVIFGGHQEEECVCSRDK